MAADWVAAVTAVVSAGAALGGQAIAGRFQGRNQERLEARQRRDRAAEILAEVRAFLVDASPDRLGINASEERSPREFEALWERRDRVRIPLLTLAGSHPSPQVRRVAQQLELEMTGTLHMAQWFIRDLLRDRGGDAAHDTAKQHHTDALRLFDQLLVAIHEPEAGRRVRGRLSRRQREAGKSPH